MASDTEKLIETLQYLISPNCCDIQFDYRDEIEHTIKFMERNLTKTVIDNGRGIYFCPQCHGSVWQIKQESKFCFRCGQALDWRKVI